MSSSINKQQVREILTTIARVSTGDYKTRVETEGKHTEFDSIAAGFNMMINEIRSRQEDLEEQREEIHALNTSLIKEMEVRKQAEDLYRDLTDSTPIGIYIVQDGKFVFFNKAFIRSNEYTEEELMGMNPLDLVHPDDREMVRQNAIKGLKGENTEPYEFRILTKYDHIIWSMETVASVLYNGERASMGNFIDISQRKEMEATIKENEEKYSKVFYANPNPMTIFSQETRIIADVNVAFVNHIGLPREECIGRRTIMNIMNIAMFVMNLVFLFPSILFFQSALPVYFTHLGRSS